MVGEPRALPSTAGRAAEVTSATRCLGTTSAGLCGRRRDRRGLGRAETPQGGNSARFYTSTNGGRTFTARSRTWTPNGNGVTGLAVNPFVEGDVWLADANNLWHSVDSGATWTKLTAMATVGAEFTNVHGAIKVALGAPAPGSGHSAAVYLVGTINGKDAVYRSDDMGANWTRIDDDNHRYGGVNGIAADTSVYGRVFLRGRGMNYNF